MPEFAIERLLIEHDDIHLSLTHQEDSFMQHVYEAVRREEIAAWGWEESFAAFFIAQQYTMQQRSYAAYYPESKRFTVSVKGVPAGKLHVAESAETVTLVDIALLPQYQGQGVGTALLRGLQRYAQEVSKPLRLTANAGGRASRLYEKLGFRILEPNEVQVRMEWIAAIVK